MYDGYLGVCCLNLCFLELDYSSRLHLSCGARHYLEFAKSELQKRAVSGCECEDDAERKRCYLKGFRVPSLTGLIAAELGLAENSPEVQKYAAQTRENPRTFSGNCDLILAHCRNKRVGDE